MCDNCDGSGAGEQGDDLSLDAMFVDETPKGKQEGAPSLDYTLGDDFSDEEGAGPDIRSALGTVLAKEPPRLDSGRAAHLFRTLRDVWGRPWKDTPDKVETLKSLADSARQHAKHDATCDDPDCVHMERENFRGGLMTRKRFLHVIRLTLVPSLEGTAYEQAALNIVERWDALSPQRLSHDPRYIVLSCAYNETKVRLSALRDSLHTPRFR